MPIGHYVMIAIAQSPFVLIVFGALLHLIEDWQWDRLMQFAGSAFVMLGLLVDTVAFGRFCGLEAQPMLGQLSMETHVRMLLEILPSALIYLGLFTFSLGYFLGAIIGRAHRKSN